MANTSGQRQARLRGGKAGQGMGARQRFAESRASGSRENSKGNGAKSRKSEAPSASKNFAMFLLTSSLVMVPLMYMWYQYILRSAITTPLNVPRTIADDASSAGRNPGRFWGSYRPGVYFGMKTRSPKSPVAGLMWFQQTPGSQNRELKLRHSCEQGDGLERYGWLEHDGVNFGIQEIVDDSLEIKTTFAKRRGGQHGGDWSATISVRYKDGVNATNEKSLLSLMFYFALDGQGSVEPILLNGDQLQGIQGSSQELGQFVLKFPQPHKVRMNTYLVSHTPGLHAVKDLVMQRLRYYTYKKKTQLIGLMGEDSQTIDASPEKKANIIVYQVTVKPPYMMDVVFESGSNANRGAELAGEELTSWIQRYSDEFNQKFEDKFGLKEKGYMPAEVSFAKAAMSNMVGGIGYFYGQSIVRSKYNSEPVPYWEAPLYTAVPSRSFFPRGFLWDEGFHNLLISKWDPYISTDIIGHWLDLMNADGWIPREQILDAEARSKVPAEFVVQFNSNANPPTLFLPLQSILQDKSSVIPRQQFLSFLKRIYPRLDKWFQWFNTTQQGPLPTSYRWRGRDGNTNRELNPKTLTSGLDDAPRASHPSDEERHVDLRCWMALASSVMVEIGKTIGAPYQEYENTLRVLSDNAILEKLHWSPKAKMFSDYGNHTTRVALERPRPPPPVPGQPRPPVSQEMVRVVKSKTGPTSKFVNSFGYVSLFPFLLQILSPSSEKLGKVLTDLKNPDLLWTKYGLRSLSKSDPIYMKYNTEHDPPYWRGAVWINMNFLAVRALHYYANVPGPYTDSAREMYTELRENIVSNIIKQYQRSGYVWENYNDVSGKGQGSHPFTGWSALVVLMMSETY